MVLLWLAFASLFFMPELFAQSPDGQVIKPGLKLVMSLSLSSYDQSAPIGGMESSDSLHEELIVKEKMIQDKYLQIKEMQDALKAMQANSTTVEAGGKTSATLQMELFWRYAGWLIALLLLILTGLYRYRKRTYAYRPETDNSVSGLFSEFHEVESAGSTESDIRNSVPMPGKS